MNANGNNLISFFVPEVLSTKSGVVMTWIPQETSVLAKLGLFTSYFIASLTVTKSVTLCVFFQIVKIDGGDYGNFGTGTNVDVQKPFLLFANRSCCKVLAASIYWHDNQQEYVEVGQRLVIPLNYPGNL